MLLGAAVPGSASVAVAEDPGRAANPPSLNERSSVIPLLTPVRIRLEADLGSQISTTGQHFPITLVAPIVVDGVERVAAGASGEGEVIHARRAVAMAAQYSSMFDWKLMLFQ